ncbi:MAG: tetratricopeptide repeat protein [Pseudomonadales bacterium]
MSNIAIIRPDRRQTNLTRRWPLLVLVALALAGCQSAPRPYDDLLIAINAGEEVDATTLRKSFYAAPDHAERLERLTALELDAYQIIEDEPLKLGSLGSAMLDTYYGSLTAHFALARFYDYLENAEAAAFHRGWIERIRADRAQGAITPAAESGSARSHSYLPATTAVEAQVYAMSEGLTPVGSIYQTLEDVPFALLIQGKPESGPIRVLYFDLREVYEDLRESFGAGDDPKFNPFSVVGYLAKDDDTAAQAAVGAFLASQNRLDDAINWLRAASRSGNLIANTLLARIFFDRARETEDAEEREAFLNETLDHYLHAITLGSSDAMYGLGILYLNGHYGDDDITTGLPLLEQAAALDNDDALLYLGHLNYQGEQVDRNLDAARDYFARASALGNPLAQKTYARFLLDRATAQPPDPRLDQWLKTLTEARGADANDSGADTEAMLLLGNLAARGLSGPINRRAAQRWYRAAVAAAPLDAAVVNEVAWTLTVSTDLELRRPEYAFKIMSTLMESNADARARPEYLDTWAATHAAIGKFDDALRVQQQAIDQAVGEEFDSVRDILAEHLALFRRGETLSEAVP